MSKRVPPSKSQWKMLNYDFRAYCYRCGQTISAGSGSYLCSACHHNLDQGEVRLDREVERGFLFLDRLKIIPQVFAASLSGSMLAGLIALVALFFLSGCAVAPGWSADVKDGTVRLCVEGRCYKVCAQESATESTSP